MLSSLGNIIAVAFHNCSCHLTISPFAYVDAPLNCPLNLLRTFEANGAPTIKYSASSLRCTAVPNPLLASAKYSGSIIVCVII